MGFNKRRCSRKVDQWNNLIHSNAFVAVDKDLIHGDVNNC